jgi:hypothetical protein
VRSWVRHRIDVVYRPEIRHKRQQQRPNRNHQHRETVHHHCPSPGKTIVPLWDQEPRVCRGTPFGLAQLEAVKR